MGCSASRKKSSNDDDDDDNDYDDDDDNNNNNNNNNLDSKWAFFHWNNANPQIICSVLPYQ